MKAFLSVGSFALALIPAVALAQQPAVCQRVEFSQEVLARFPNIRKACLDVINKDGQEYAVVKADLVRATSRRMTVRVKLPDGTHSDPIGINIKGNARVNVNGQPTRIEDIAIGQELSAYINVTDPGIALAPVEPKRAGRVHANDCRAGAGAGRGSCDGNAKDRDAAAAPRYHRFRSTSVRRWPRIPASPCVGLNGEYREEAT